MKASFFGAIRADFSTLQSDLCRRAVEGGIGAKGCSESLCEVQVVAVPTYQKKIEAVPDYGRLRKLCQKVALGKSFPNGALAAELWRMFFRMLRSRVRSFGADLGPKSTPDDPHGTSDNLKLQPHVL